MFEVNKMVSSLTNLGCDSNSSMDDIRKSYRELAKKTHPDKNTEYNAAEMFKIVQESYEYVKQHYNHFHSKSIIAEQMIQRERKNKNFNEAKFRKRMSHKERFFSAFREFLYFPRSKADNSYRVLTEAYTSLFKKPVPLRLLV